MIKDQEFAQVFKENIRREGADQLLEFLLSKSSDFFTAPASTRFHAAYEGGLVEHSLNVYFCLKDYLSRSRIKEMCKISYTEETVAIAGLLHDLCKINCYKKSTRNVRDEKGIWQSVPYFEFEDKLPYGHGEKSVYLLSGFIKLTREEAFAIRYHMGFSGVEEKTTIAKVFQQYPLALALSIADMEATYYLEG